MYEKGLQGNIGNITGRNEKGLQGHISNITGMYEVIVELKLSVGIL